jgi:FkbM family methyltransferase
MISNYLKEIKNQEHPLKFIIAKLLIRTNLCTFFQIKQNSYKLKFYPSALSRQLWINPNYLHTASRFFQDYLQKNDCVVDVGSSIGTVTLTSASIVGFDGKVYSIEPNPRIFKYLEGNIKLNHFNNIQTFNVALGNKDGTICFSDQRSDDINSVNDLDNGIKVQIKTLDSLSISDESISLLKIDAIGYEKFVLLGGQKLLEKTKCVHIPIVEKHLEQYGCSFQDILDILVQNNFELFEFVHQKFIKINLETYVPHDEDIIAVKDIDDFFKRTEYKL